MHPRRFHPVLPGLSFTCFSFLVPILSHLFGLWPRGRTYIWSDKRLLVGVQTHYPLSPFWAERFRSRPLTANPPSARASALRCLGS